MTVLLEDPRAEHQIRLRGRSGSIIVSCTCLNAWTGTWRSSYWPHRTWANPRGWTGARARGEVIEVRTLFPAADAIAAWRAWHEQRGVAV